MCGLQRRADVCYVTVLPNSQRTPFLGVDTRRLTLTFSAIRRLHGSSKAIVDGNGACICGAQTWAEKSPFVTAR